MQNKCYHCGKTFRNRREVMNHRKIDHTSYVEPCTKFIKGECPFQSKFCWFKHTEAPTKSLDEGNVVKDNFSVFQKATKTSKPPLKPQENKA